MTRAEAQKEMLNKLSDAHAAAENDDFDEAAMWAESALEIWREHLPAEEAPDAF
jgi:hypothetical protein